MALLHHERWPELAPEFASAKLLAEVVEQLSIDDATPTMAAALKAVKEAQGFLHPCTRDPAALEEFEQRQAGEFGASAKAKQQADQRDATIAALTARLNALEGQRDAATTKTEGKAKNT